MPSIAGQHVLVIGGTSGIGFGVAQAVLAAGAKVVVASSKTDKVEKAVSRLHEQYLGLSDKISGYTVDLNDLQNLESNVEELYEKVTNNGEDKLDHIINTAGTTDGMKLLNTITPEELLSVGTLRLVAPLILAKLSPAYLKQSSRSSITNTSGSLADKPLPGMASVAGWASALDGVTRGLALDFAPVRVNLVKPGAVKTELWGDSEMAARRVETLADKLPVKRAGSTEDAAEAYVYLLRDGYVTGSCVSSNGGVLLI